jgi:hypothetical protein
MDQVAGDRASWSVSGHSLRIEYSSAVLDEIASAVMAAFGEGETGCETGGVLFGKHTGDCVRILAWRPIAREGASGRRLELSADCGADLAIFLNEYARDRGLKGLVPVGWAQSVLRRHLSLAGDARQIYDRFFPEPWQVALLIRPGYQKSTSAGFFFREEDGRIHAHGSYREFELFPAAHAAPPADSEAAADNPPAARGIPRWLKWFTAAVVTAALALVCWLWLWPALFAGSALRVASEQDTLRIEWDPRAPAVADAVRAVVEVVEAGRKETITLTSADLARGGYSYKRTGGDVRIRVSFERPGKAPVVESTRFVGPLPKR